MEQTINNLRQRLENQRISTHKMVDDLERDRASALLGHISTVMHEQVIVEYEATAKNLLYLIPDDSEAKDALRDAEQLRRRVDS
jgi:hypothetical protein